MRVLVVGGGGREHALTRALARSREVDGLLCAPGNAGTAELAENVAVGATDVDRLVRLAREREVGLVVIGPEAPLAAGLVDALRAEGIRAFGPTRAAARLEASKAFAKDLMRERGVPTADYAVFDDPAAADAYVQDRGRPMVVKADGLAAGKGVVVASTVAECRAAIRRLMVEEQHGSAGHRVVIEERLEGPEVSYHVLTDGQRYVPLAAAQDHKRLLAGDAGPNTGGMGAYSPPPMVDAALEATIREAVVEPTLAGMAARGAPLQGALFIGLMLVDGEPRVLEYNVRFGDPETEVMMARLDDDLLPWLDGAARGALDDRPPTWGAPTGLSVVLASEGYPGPSPKGRPIEGIDDALSIDGVTVDHAGTARDGEGRLVTAGGRVLAVTGVGADLDQAAERAYRGVRALRFAGAQHRPDIGWQARTR
ncbi:MAG: phosphoribosylamine--glycine ligase [Sandaracinaceae bacterium]